VKKNAMHKNTHPGKFIVFEGLDCSGNSTQADLLLRNIVNSGVRAELTKEPTNFLIGGLIRSALNHDWEPSPECLQMLFSADRAHHLSKQIPNLLRKGVHVICDRYFLSTIAFGLLGVPDEEWLLAINRRFMLPDVTFIMKVDPKICSERIAERRNTVELFEREESLKTVWGNYERLAGKFDSVHIIDGERDRSVISQEIWSLVEPILKT